MNARNGYELAIGHSGNAGEVDWYWLTNPSPSSITGKPSLTVNVKENASFTATGFSRSWTVGTHKLFYIDKDQAQAAGMTEKQIELIEGGKLFAEYILNDEGKRSRINYTNEKGESVDALGNIIAVPKITYKKDQEEPLNILYRKYVDKEGQESFLEPIFAYSTEGEEKISLSGRPD